MPIYPRPPIVEAVIEVQFSDSPMSKRDMERFVKKIERKYPGNELMSDYEVGVQIANGQARGAEAKLKQEWFRCVGHDVADLLNIRPTSMVTARTAPYESWEVLFASFAKDFETLRKVTGFMRATRVGVRYINRIDIPSPQSVPVDPRRYLNIYPHLPFSNYPLLSANFSNVHFKDEEGTNLIIRAGQADPVLINRTSLILDIDAFIFEEVPLKIDSVLKLYDKLRHAKNRIFEALITAEGRALFQ
ncbi:TIGR04255 family protein [Rhizobium leguminosarum]|uniref:TIGR04255 family protein n=1 Tax=Rhizobium ruizarguesonis TaxID=2081791 RepID=UPI0013BF8DFC|nr:TIGR04255 family protein [Rhizobium ruizarguesonis]NEI22947.1 TIGR04255 family protein [Rhizobium ruizarguesonis]